MRSITVAIPRGFLQQNPKAEDLHGDRKEGREICAKQMSWKSSVCLKSHTRQFFFFFVEQEIFDLDTQQGN